MFTQCSLELRATNTGSQRGSVVRTSDFGWRTFPDLRLINGWQVINLLVTLCYGSTNSTNSAFHPPRVGKWIVSHIITWIMGWRPLNSSPGLREAVWLWVKSQWKLACTAAYRLHTCSVCDTKALLQLRYVACGRHTSVICLCLLHHQPRGCRESSV